MNINYTYFFVRSGKHILFDVHQNFSNKFMCHEIKKVEKHFSKQLFCADDTVWHLEMPVGMMGFPLLTSFRSSELNV